MRLVRKSIIRKLFVNLFLFSLLIAAIAFYFFYTDQQLIPFSVFLGALGLFLIYFLVAYWMDIVRPLRSVLGQMQLLIAGKPYKRIYTTRIDEVGIIAHFFNQVTAGLGEVSHDIKDRERLLEELNVASQLQRDILPLNSPMVKGLQIVAKTRPATELGGDSFNFLKTKDLTYIYIGDVTGHGVAAGLIMTMVNSLMNVFVDIYSSPYEVLVMINKYIKKHVKKAMFMTMVLLSWDEKNQQLKYVGAGHEHIIVYRMETGVCEAIMSGGVALGMVPDNSKVIKEKVLDLKNGDFVVLYTDGITEARNVEGELFGLDRLKNLVTEYASQYSADGVNYHIARDVSDFAQGHIQDDDMTLIVIKRDDSFTGAEAVSVPVNNWASQS